MVKDEVFLRVLTFFFLFNLRGVKEHKSVTSTQETPAAAPPPPQPQQPQPHLQGQPETHGWQIVFKSCSRKNDRYRNKVTSRPALIFWLGLVVIWLVTAHQLDGCHDVFFFPAWWLSWWFIIVYYHNPHSGLVGISHLLWYMIAI